MIVTTWGSSISHSPGSLGSISHPGNGNPWILAMISHQCGYNVGRRDLQIVGGSALWSCPCHVWKCLKLGNLPNATRVESQGLIAQISHRYRVMFQVSRCFHVSSSHKFGLAVLWYLTILVISRVTRHRPLPQSKFLAPPLKSNGFNKTM